MSFEFARTYFLNLFRNRHNSIVRSIKTDGAWRTVSQFFYLTDFQLLQAVEGGAVLRGTRWDSDTNYFVLDIDQTSPYHNPKSLYEITYKLKQLGLEKVALFRSSHSGGWHIYCFLDQTFNSDRLSSQIRIYLRKSGFEVGNGVLEVFPSGNALRLPLQSGFAFLDANCLVTDERDQMSFEDAVCCFTQIALSTTNSANGLLQRIEQELSNQSLDVSRQEQTGREDDCPAQSNGDDQMVEFDQMVQDAHDKMHDDRWRLGRNYWLNGLSSKNQRHEAILAVGYYLWFGDPAAGLPRLAGQKCADQRARLLNLWIQEKHNGFCRHINRSKWKAIEQDIDRAVHWVRYQAQHLRVPYLLTERLLDRQQQTLLTIEQLKRANEKREDGARQKIALAVQEMNERGEKLTQRALARATGCSRNTIKKHADLWLSCGSSDLSSVQVGGVPGLSELDECTQELFVSSPASEFYSPVLSVVSVLATPISDSQTEAKRLSVPKTQRSLPIPRQLRLVVLDEASFSSNDLPGGRSVSDRSANTS